jgi:hypothetical protein
MNENQAKQNNLIETTDCLEAVGVFKGWKNFLFVIALVCLLLLQVSFWLVDTGCVKTNGDIKGEPSAVAAEGREKIEEAAEKVVAEPNQPTEAAPQPQQAKSGWIKIKYLTCLVRFLDFVLILVAILYCLTMLFSLKVSLLGRLGGINFIARAFFLSLVFVVLLLPWQRFFAGVVAGAMYTPKEFNNLLNFRADLVEQKGAVLGMTLYYLRFTGYWVLVLLLLIFAQSRSARWAKAILHRMELV